MYEIIDEKVIENCELNDACDEGLHWLRKTPRTYQDLRTYRMEWFRWMAEHCTLPTVLEKLSTDTDAYVRYGVAANQQTPVTDDFKTGNPEMGSLGAQRTGAVPRSARMNCTWKASRFQSSGRRRKT